MTDNPNEPNDSISGMVWRLDDGNWIWCFRNVYRN